MELTDRSVSKARAIFQRHQPHCYSVSQVTLSEIDDTIQWEVTFNSNQNDYTQKCQTVKQQMQLSYHNIARVGSVSKITTITGLQFWKTTFYPEYKYGVSRTSVKTSIPHASYDEFTILVRRSTEDIIIPIHEYNEETDLPRKLFQHGKNVTSQFTRRTTLCRSVMNVIKDNLSKGCNYVRSLLVRPKKSRLTNRTPIVFVKPETEPLVSEHFPPLVEEDTTISPSPSYDVETRVERQNRTYAAVAFDYEKLENAMQKRSLADPRVFKAARMYILSNMSTFGLKVSPITFKTFRKIELANILKQSGLPTDSSLLDIYTDFCTETGICSDVVTDLKDELALALKLGQAVR